MDDDKTTRRTVGADDDAEGADLRAVPVHSPAAPADTERATKSMEEFYRDYPDGTFPPYERTRG